MPREASMVEMMKYFGTDTRPVSAAEFKNFWSSLSDPDKDFYKVGIAALIDA